MSNHRYRNADPSAFAAGVASDHAAALLPAALALDLVGGGAVLGHAPCHAHAPAVAAEELPVGQPRGFGDGLHPAGDLGLRQPEYFLIAAGARRYGDVPWPYYSQTWTGKLSPWVRGCRTG